MKSTTKYRNQIRTQWIKAFKNFKKGGHGAIIRLNSYALSGVYLKFSYSSSRYEAQIFMHVFRGPIFFRSKPDFPVSGFPVILDSGKSFYLSAANHEGFNVNRLVTAENFVGIIEKAGMHKFLHDGCTAEDIFKKLKDYSDKNFIYRSIGNIVALSIAAYKYNGVSFAEGVLDSLKSDFEKRRRRKSLPTDMSWDDFRRAVCAHFDDKVLDEMRDLTLSQNGLSLTDYGLLKDERLS